MRILAGSRVLFTGQHQCPEFDCPQGALPGKLKVLLALIDGAERRRQIQAQLNRTQPRDGLPTRIKRALLALCVLAVIGHTTKPISLSTPLKKGTSSLAVVGLTQEAGLALSRLISVSISSIAFANA